MKIFVVYRIPKTHQAHITEMHKPILIAVKYSMEHDEYILV